MSRVSLEMRQLNVEKVWLIVHFYEYSTEILFCIKLPCVSRNCNALKGMTSQNVSNSGSESESDQDPFKGAAESENDPDYQLPKKPRVEKNQKKVRKQLSNHERLKRLKSRISTKYGAAPVLNNGENDRSAANEICIDEICFDSLFESIPIEEALHESIIAIEHDSLIAKNDNATKTVNQIEIESAISEPDRFLELCDMIADMNRELVLLRKQVARIELKQMSWPVGNDGNVRHSNNVAIGSDDLFDFDTSLAKEGLPLKTCVEMNDFEKKLKNEPQYKLKIVS